MLIIRNKEAYVLDNNANEIKRDNIIGTSNSDGYGGDAKDTNSGDNISLLKNNRVELNAKTNANNDDIDERKIDPDILNEKIPGYVDGIVVIPENSDVDLTKEEISRRAKEEIKEEFQMAAKRMTVMSTKTVLIGAVAFTCIGFITKAITTMASKPLPNDIIVDYGMDYSSLQKELNAYIEKIDAIESNNYTLTYKNVNSNSDSNDTDENTAEYIFRGDDRNKEYYFSTVEDSDGWLVDSYRIKIGNGVSKEYAKSYQISGADTYYLNLNPMLSLLGYVTELDYELPNYVVMDSENDILEFSTDKCGIYNTEEYVRVVKPNEPYYTLFKSNNTENGNVEQLSNSDNNSIDYVVKYSNDIDYGETRIIDEVAEPRIDKESWSVILPVNSKDITINFYSAVMKFIKEEMHDSYAISDEDITFTAEGDSYLDFISYIKDNMDCDYSSLIPDYLFSNKLSVIMNLNYYDVLNKSITIDIDIVNEATGEKYNINCEHSNKTIVNNPGIDIESNYILSETDWTEIRNLMAQADYNLYYDGVISDNKDIVNKYNNDLNNYTRIAKYNNEPVVTDDRGIVIKDLVENDQSSEEEVNYTLDSNGNRIYNTLDEALDGLREQATNGDARDYKVYYRNK